jgi:hypothetical protein
MASSLEGIKAMLEEIVKDPKYHDILSLVKTARNGAVYGTKVRFPHALVMIFLFRSGTYVHHPVLLVLLHLLSFATDSPFGPPRNQAYVVDRSCEQ